MNTIDFTAAKAAIERARAERERQNEEDKARRAKAKSYPKMLGGQTANWKDEPEEPPIVITRSELVELIQEEVKKGIEAHVAEEEDRAYQRRMMGYDE